MLWGGGDYVLVKQDKCQGLGQCVRKYFVLSIIQRGVGNGSNVTKGILISVEKTDQMSGMATI